VENQEVQYDTEVIKDPGKRAGTSDEVIQQGKNGAKLVTFEITKINGQMNEEQLVDEKIIVPSVKAVVKKGTKVVLGEGTGKFSWPVLSASLTSGFGVRWGKMHKGIDLSGNRNILASDNGRVESAGYRNDYGNYIVVDHMNGYKTLYGHLSQILTSVGKTVEKGEKIGIMGSTGDSTGVHLHFEIQRNESPENPLKYLNR
jgi:murein DD-endopeptidase MepM/ murein hydrolase activator NlpD